MSVPKTIDLGELKATLQEGGRVNLDFIGVPIAVGPVVQLKQQTILLLSAWLQSAATDAKFEEVRAGNAPQGKKPSDLEAIKKFIDDLKKQIPGVITQIKQVFPHPISKAMETAMSAPLRGIVEEIMTEDPMLREKLKELIKNQLEDSISQDEKWQEGEEGKE